MIGLTVKTAAQRQAEREDMARAIRASPETVRGRSSQIPPAPVLPLELFVFRLLLPQLLPRDISALGAFAKVPYFAGAPEEIRTPDPQIRSFVRSYF
jgi:hypothetical protein